jgi:hypothetical protein
LKIFLTTAFLSFTVSLWSQSNADSLLIRIDVKKWPAIVEKKAHRLQEKILVKSEKTLQKMQRQEEKIYAKMLQGKDSLLARASLAQMKERYGRLLNNVSNNKNVQAVTKYIPCLDTINTSLKFLYQHKGGENLRKALAETQALQDKFQQAEDIKRFIRERKQQLRAQLENIGLAKQLKQFNKQAYYYSEQMKEYAEGFKDSRKAQKKAIELLSKTKLFQDFMRKNSMLASLFRLPGENPNDPVVQASMAGLQTRSQVNSLIQQQIASGGPNGQQQFRQNMQEAQSQINQLKNKVTQSGGGSSEEIMPEGFKLNAQKTKNFFKRLEYGTNIQTQRATSFFPVTSDIGLSIGYKLNDKSIIGVGASYKMGWGRGWNNISITGEGAGLRSFVDLKLKGSLWVSGGYEQNYKNALNDLRQLRNYNAWQKSGLIGLSKVVSLKTKFFKNTRLRLLWDFLSYKQIPRTQSVIFRVGYNF